MTLEGQFEYMRQVAEIHGKIDFCYELVEELVNHKWPFVSKDKLIKIYLTRAHKLDDISNEMSPSDFENDFAPKIIKKQ